MSRTKIEWCDRVWNPVTGCTKVSAGCKNCYAERIAARFWGERKFTDIRCHLERLYDPYRWRKPSLVFVNSMSDLFHPEVDKEFIGDVFCMMQKTPQQTYMILTKRPKEMLYWFNLMNAEDPLPNVWLGVSVEDQPTAEERITLLLKTPATLRFLSIEPMLSSIDIRGFLPHIDWVICGCESGQKARPMDLDWALDLHDQCRAANVPFFLKQAVIDGKFVREPQLSDYEFWQEYPKVYYERFRVH